MFEKFLALHPVRVCELGSDTNAPTVGLLDTHHRVEQGRLSGTVATHQRDDLSAPLRAV